MTLARMAPRLALALLMVTGIGVAASFMGCARGAQETPQDTKTTEAHDDSDHTHGALGTGESVTPGTTVGDIRGQIQQQQLALETAVHEGKLSEVHEHAFAIRDLAVAVGEKAGAGADRAAQQKSIDSIRTIAGQLDSYGDAGNLSGTEDEFKKLNDALAALWAAAGT